MIDSKNRKAWQNRYTEKLRHDRDAAKADHGILATSVFPSGEKDLCLRDSVVVVRPHGVIPIVRLLRSSLIANHTKRLGAQEREAKAAAIYEYMNSAEFKRTLGTALSACDALEELDVDEKKTHDKTWQRRGTLQREIARALGDVETRVCTIVEHPRESQHQIA